MARNYTPAQRQAMADRRAMRLYGPLGMILAAVGLALTGPGGLLGPHL
jgi:hypothetical protein